MVGSQAGWVAKVDQKGGGGPSWVTQERGTYLSASLGIQLLRLLMGRSHDR